MPGDEERVDIVIPNWNRRDDLVRLLESLARQTHPPAQIVVVDNGSTDGSATCAEKCGATIIRFPENRGFARAVNEGLDHVRAPWVAIVNNDATLAPDYLKLLIEAAIQSGAAFAVGKILRDVEGDELFLDATFDLLTRSGCAWRAGHCRTDGPVWRSRRMVHFAPMTAALFRTSLFEEFGPLDVEFESYLEDLEFSCRLARNEQMGIYVPEALAWHRGSATLGAGSPAMYRLVSRNQVLLAARHLPAACLWRAIVGQLLWGLLSLRRGMGGAWLRGKIEGLRLWRRCRRRPLNAEAFLAHLKSSESYLRELQDQTGWDGFWRWYFRLIP